VHAHSQAASASYTSSPYASMYMPGLHVQVGRRAAAGDVVAGGLRGVGVGALHSSGLAASQPALSLSYILSASRISSSPCARQVPLRRGTPWAAFGVVGSSRWFGRLVGARWGAAPAGVAGQGVREIKAEGRVCTLPAALAPLSVMQAPGDSLLLSAPALVGRTLGARFGARFGARSGGRAALSLRQHQVGIVGGSSWPASRLFSAHSAGAGGQAAHVSHHPRSIASCIGVVSASAVCLWAARARPCRRRRACRCRR
jgi:hypothetical protein